MNDNVTTFLANLKHGIRNGQTVEVGSGLFNGQELVDVVAALEQSVPPRATSASGGNRSTVAQKHDYQLDVEVSPYDNGRLISVSFLTLFPKAQRPHWVRNLQLNLTPEQLDNLRNSLSL